MGITALLVAFPPCLSQTVNELADMQTQPLLSGSVCRVRDTVDFLSVSANGVFQPLKPNSYGRRCIIYIRTVFIRLTTNCTAVLFHISLTTLLVCMYVVRSMAIYKDSHTSFFLFISSIYLFGDQMSLFPSIFCTISTFSLYGEYVVRSFLPNGVFSTL